MGDAQQDRVNQKITAAAFASKYKSKRGTLSSSISFYLFFLFLECYNFLSIDCNIYLPPFENLTIYFLKSLINK